MDEKYEYYESTSARASTLSRERPAAHEPGERRAHGERDSSSIWCFSSTEETAVAPRSSPTTSTAWVPRSTRKVSLSGLAHRHV